MRKSNLLYDWGNQITFQVATLELKKKRLKDLCFQYQFHLLLWLTQYTYKWYQTDLMFILCNWFKRTWIFHFYHLKLLHLIWSLWQSCGGQLESEMHHQDRWQMSRLQPCLPKTIACTRFGWKWSSLPFM